MMRSLNTGDVALLILYATSLAGGQVLFKYAALTTAEASSGIQKFANLALNPAFILAIVLYAGLSVFWVWLLARVPLSHAYPFVALAFMLTLTAGVMLFNEPATPRLVIGGALILGGLLVIAA